MDFDAMRQALEEQGVIHVPQILTGDALSDAQAAFDWSRDNPGPRASAFADDPNAWQDLSNPLAHDAYRPMLERSPLPALLQRLWGGGPVWFMYEQTFFKKGTIGRTAWHQDSSYLPVAGSQLGVVWITFDPVSREEALEFCLGSHRGPLFNGTRFTPGDPTDPIYPEGTLPRLPDVEAQRQKWDIAAWATQPGDVLIFHPQMLHGGGAPRADGQRRTLTLRFFGQDATYDTRPGRTAAPDVPGLHEALSQGEPFRHPAFPLLA